MPCYVKLLPGTALALGLSASPVAAQVWMDPSNNPRYQPIVRPNTGYSPPPAYVAPWENTGRPVYVQPAPARPAYVPETRRAPAWETPAPYGRELRVQER